MKPDTPRPDPGPPDAPIDGNVAARWVSMDSLHPWEGNPRKNEATIARVAASIKRFGWGAVIVARLEDGEMVAGHTRFAAAQLLVEQWAVAQDADKWHPDAVRTASRLEVPARFGEWSDHEAHLLAVADNKLQEYSEWDDKKLAELLGGYTQTETNVAGYEAMELSKLFASLKDEFNPGNADGQSGLDVKDPTVCPKCGHEF